MSLATLRALRLHRRKPASVFLLILDCPKPWPWLRDDESNVWLDPRCDVRAADLRPLHGLPVVALVDDATARQAEVEEAMADVGAELLGIADAESAAVYDAHPWRQFANLIDWRADAGAVMCADHERFWSM
jgi:hypothetical protein